MCGERIKGHRSPIAVLWRSGELPSRLFISQRSVEDPTYLHIQENGNGVKAIALHRAEGCIETRVQGMYFSLSFTSHPMVDTIWK